MRRRNKKGLALFFYMMIGIVFFVLGIALAPALVQTVDESMADPLLNCSTTTDNQTKAVCRSMDIQKLFVGVVFGLAGMIIFRGAIG